MPNSQLNSHRKSRFHRSGRCTVLRHPPARRNPVPAGSAPGSAARCPPGCAGWRYRSGRCRPLREPAGPVRPAPGSLPAAVWENFPLPVRYPQRAVPVFPVFQQLLPVPPVQFRRFPVFRLRRGRLSLLHGAFRCLFRGSGRCALGDRCRVSRCRAACLRRPGGNVGYDRAHGQSFRLCRQQGRCPCAAHSQNQRHGQRCNGCRRFAAGCAGSVKSFFHLSSLPPNLPVVQRSAARVFAPLPGAGLLLFHAAHGFRIKRTADDNFTLPLVYTRTRGAVNGTAGFYTNSPPGQCVGKCSKWNTFRRGRTLHKAEISHFSSNPLLS